MRVIARAFYIVYWERLAGTISNAKAVRQKQGSAACLGCCHVLGVSSSMFEPPAPKPLFCAR